MKQQDEYLEKAKALAESRLFLTVQDVEDIQDIVSYLPLIPIVVDLGAGSGTTALSVYEKCHAAEVHTVDINRENLEWAELNLRANQIDITKWYGVFSDASECFLKENSVDFLMHDAGHEYEDVFNDIKAWHLAMKPNAYIWIHDYKPMFSDEYPGVKQAIDELISLGLIVPDIREAKGIGFRARVVK